jgi:hypothetical protein
MRTVAIVEHVDNVKKCFGDNKSDLTNKKGNRLVGSGSVTLEMKGL